jgi:hypothetical protein
MVGALKRVVDVNNELLLWVEVVVEANVEREEDVVRVEFEKSAIVWLLKRDGGRIDEELKTPESVGKADELLKGADVSVSVDADEEDDDAVSSDWAEAVVVDGGPSLGSGSKPERDTLGNASPSAVRPAVTSAGRSSDVGGTGSGLGSERRVSTLVTEPVASM